MAKANSSKSKAGSKTLYIPQTSTRYGGISESPTTGAGVNYDAAGIPINRTPATPKGAWNRMDPVPKPKSQPKVDTLYPPPPPTPPNCETDPLIKCIAGLIQNILPPEGGTGVGRKRLTKDIYVGIPCNADRCCIDKFLGKPGSCCPPTCGPPKCCAPCGGGCCGGGSCGIGGCGGGCVGGSCGAPKCCCGPPKCCCPPVCGAPKCCPRKGRRYRRRSKSQKSQEKSPGAPETNNNNTPSNPKVTGSNAKFKDGGNYAQMTDAAVNARVGPSTPAQRNVVTGMMSRTMFGNIEDVMSIPVEEVVVTPPRASNPGSPPPRPKPHHHQHHHKGPRLTRFVVPSGGEDDRSTRLDSRRETSNSRPATTKGYTNFREDNDRRGKVWPFRPTFD